MSFMCQPKDDIYTADRREGDIWVLEAPDGSTAEYKDLPEGVYEGAKLQKCGEKFVILEKSAENRKEIRNRMQKLFKKADEY